MGNEYWQSSPFGEDSLFYPNFKSQQEQYKKKNEPKTSINLLIVLDPSGKKQFDDTKNSIWSVNHFQSLSNFETVKNLILKNSFKNLCLVHHGNVYSAVTLSDDDKIIFGVGRMEQMDKIINAIGSKPFVDLNEEYFQTLHNKSKELFQGGYQVNELKAYCCLKGLIGNINGGGNYFSIACDEADDPKLLPKLSTFTDNNINFFANSNYTVISRNYTYAGITNYGSILNSFLTDSKNWNDISGWKHFDKSKNEILITKKDLWLYSKHKTKIYELISRNKELTTSQSEKESWAQTYFSIGFERQYKKKYGELAYKDYIKTVELKYPEFKN